MYFTNNKIRNFNSKIDDIQPLINTDNEGLISHKSVDENFSELTTNSINLLNENFPLVKLSRSKARDKPYMTAALKVSIKHKNKLHHKDLTNKTHVNKVIWQNYRRKLSSTIQIAEKAYIQNMVNNHSSNSQDMWKFFGSILNNKSKQKVAISKIKVDDKTITNQAEIANEFNKFFLNIEKT